MRGVLHAEVFGFNFSADTNPYQRSDDCVIVAGQITERPHDVKAVRYTQPTLRCKRTVRSQTDFTPPPDWNPYDMCVWRTLPMMALEFQVGEGSVRISTPRLCGPWESAVQLRC